MDNNELYSLSIDQLENKNNSISCSMNKNKLNEYDYFIGDIEVDEFLPETPTKTGYIEEEEIKKSILSLIKLNIEIGLYPVVYQGENNGRLIRNVVPKKVQKIKLAHMAIFMIFSHMSIIQI
ncbi:hypothetical protein FE392_12300 [Xenorhabdus sp. 12]|uniref:Uncharacterized protein n=1 Tax=Xenorhabdus santafensis TaxID=2582833 RepID=A0ABU4SBG7_9GAMM|nr:hypothetical protein [Xenorhabdus sp. 12]MDX7988105.1 hypothetical protein [Xenorhabdus sp. 12]